MLYRIAYTTCIDSLRKKKLLFFMPHMNMELMSFRQQKTKDSSFISGNLKETLLKLSPAERALVFQRVIEEKSYAELEEIYHVSSSTLRKRYERAKKKLSKALQETNLYYERLEGSKNEI